MFFYDPVEIQNELGLSPVPAFWDDRLVSLALSIPTDWKMRAGTTKYILRKAAALNLDENYWMLPKIGLQDSFAYVSQSEEGRGWYNEQIEKIRNSKEYQILQEILPGGIVRPARLIGLINWKKIMI
jgi:asparagine synthetase B (glutamine-hydrolysing)